MIRVMLIEASDVLRNALTRFLDSDPDIKLLGVASGLADAMKLVKKLTPDVVLLGLHSREETTLAPSKIRSLFSGTRVVAMSLKNDDDAHRMADRFGAVAFVDKMTLASDLLPAIKGWDRSLSDGHAV